MTYSRTARSCESIPNIPKKTFQFFSFSSIGGTQYRRTTIACLKKQFEPCEDCEKGDKLNAK